MFKFLVFIALGVAFVAAFPSEEESTIKKLIKYHRSTPGHCLVLGFHIKEGDEVPAPLGHCKKIKCKDASTNRVLTVECENFLLPGPCRRSKRNMRKYYPDCCPKMLCPN